MNHPSVFDDSNRSNMRYKVKEKNQNIMGSQEELKNDGMRGINQINNEHQFQ